MSSGGSLNPLDFLYFPLDGPFLFDGTFYRITPGVQSSVLDPSVPISMHTKRNVGERGLPSPVRPGRVSKQ